jgi:hypothetical protein
MFPELMFPEQGWLDDALFDAIIHEEPMAHGDIYPDIMPPIAPEETHDAGLVVIGSPMALLTSGIIQDTATLEHPEPATQPVEVAITRNETAALALRKYYLLTFFFDNANP